MWISLWQTPAASTFSSTSVPLGCGVGRSIALQRRAAFAHIETDHGVLPGSYFCGQEHSRSGGKRHHQRAAPSLDLVWPSSTVARSVERAVERRQHAALDEIERRRLPVARTRQIGHDLLLMRPGRGRITMIRSASTIASSTSWVTRPATSAAVRPQIEQMVLQVDAGESIERRERLVEQQHFGPRHQRARDARRAAPARRTIRAATPRPFR